MGQFESEIRGLVTALDNEVGKLHERFRKLRQDMPVGPGELWPGRRLTSSLLGSDVASDAGSFVGSVVESVTSSVIGLTPEEREERRRRLLPQVATSGRTRLRQRRQERLRQQGRTLVATCPESETICDPVPPKPAA